MRKLLKSQSGVVHILPLLVIIAAIGIISYLLVSSTAPAGGLFGLLNPKPGSRAAINPIPSPFPNCTPFSGTVPISQATPPYNPATHIGGLEAEPQGPIWCFPLTVKQPTRVAGANDWIDNFDAGMMGRLNDNDMDYRVFNQIDDRFKGQQFINANHWMVDLVDISPFRLSGGIMMSPNKKFFFEHSNGTVCNSSAPDCKFVFETDAAAGADGMGGADHFYEMDVAPSRPTGVTVDALYGYGQFGNQGAIGCRMEGGNFVCSQYDNSGHVTGGECPPDGRTCTDTGGRPGRVWETQGVGYDLTGPHIGNYDNFPIPDGGGLQMKDVLRGCKTNQMDYFCRDRFRMELTKTTLTMYVNGYLVFQLQNLPAVNPNGADSRVPESWFTNGVYVYMTSWINSGQHTPLRWHWDNLAVNPHNPGRIDPRPPTSAPSFCLGSGVENNSCPILTSDSSGINVPGKNQVDVLDYFFNQPNVNITAGDTVTWTNKGKDVHTVTSDQAGLFDSGNITAGQTYSRKFDTPGVYSYHCTPHPGMTGTVTVYPVGGGTPPPTPVVTPTPTPSPIQQLMFSATLVGSSETPPNSSQGTGNAMLMLNPDGTGTMTLSFSGLSAPSTAAHIHGPAPVGTAAPIIVGLPIPTSVTSGSITSSPVTLSAQNVTDLKNGLLYVNVHSTQFPAGEIRGQLTSGTPQPTATPTPQPTPTATPLPTPTSTPGPISGTFNCTVFLGYSQTNNWFPAFEGSIDSPRNYELQWQSGGAAHFWIDPNYAGWSQPKSFPCSQSTDNPDRVVFDITQDEYLDTVSDPVGKMEQIIRDLLPVVHQQVPSARQIVVQPVTGGPNESICTFSGDGLHVRASVNHPYIRQAIDRVVASPPSIGVPISKGNNSQVGSCDQYADSTGHLTGPGAGSGQDFVGQQNARFYSGGSGGPLPTATPQPTSTPRPTNPPTAAPTATPRPISGRVTVPFDDAPGQDHVLNGQYPAGQVDWGTDVWYLSGPWQQFTTKSVSFNGPGGVSQASFQLLSPGHLESLQAYNGGTLPSTVTISCQGQPTITRTVTQAAAPITIQTGWLGSCLNVTMASSNGWDTNFDNMVFADPTINPLPTPTVPPPTSPPTVPPTVPPTTPPTVPPTITPTVPGCTPPVCPAPPQGCSYQGVSACSCGTLVCITPPPVSGGQTITFNDLPLKLKNKPLNGQYPQGVIDWGSYKWFLSGPWQQLKTNSISFNGPGIFKAKFSFITPRVLVSLLAYNGGKKSSTINVVCNPPAGSAGPSQLKSVTIAVEQIVTINTGFANACGSVTVSSTNGWDTNFDDLVIR